MIDDDYTLVTYEAYSRFLMIDSNKYISNYEILYNLLEIDLEEINTTEYNSLLAALHSIAMRSLFDCMFLFDLKNLMSPEKLMPIDISQPDDEPPVYYDRFMEQMTKQLFSLDVKIVEIAIEGFAKLILHQRLDDNIESLCLLTVLWHDKGMKNESPAATQYLSVFTNIVANSRIDDIDKLQEAFQRVFQYILSN